MVAICLFLLDLASKDEGHRYVGYIILGDTFVYIFLVLLSIRGLRSIGLDKNYDEAQEYIAHLKSEMIVKYSIVQIVNSLTIVATVALGGAVGMGWLLS